MYGPEQILSWLQEHVHGVRLSRLKTLSVIVGAAMVMRGVGVLALGRAMAGEVCAKHCIKRVWRFFRNAGIEREAICAGLLGAVAPAQGPIVVLVDWTYLRPFMTLVFAVPRDGRALPFYTHTIRCGTSEREQRGTMVDAEYAAMDALRRIMPEGRDVILIGDRAFGHSRWLNTFRMWGWGFVQRLASNHQVEVFGYTGFLKDMPIRRGEASRDWGWGDLGERHEVGIRLITVWSPEHEEPWYIATSLKEAFPAEIVRFYRRRMWIEAMFRDLKNRNWGLGLEQVRLSQPERHDRHFLVLMIAYLLLVAFGAAAETLGLADLYKANTSTERVMSLARIGNYFAQICRYPIKKAWLALSTLPT